MLKIFIGMDTRQPIAYSVLQNSIHRNAESFEYTVSPLLYPQINKIMPRKGLTEFTYTRFLIPYLCNYKGWALFMDADMLVTGNILEFNDLKDDTCDVMVVKNKEKFEWPSLMFFNNRKCKKLTPEYIATQNPYEMKDWANKVGELPAEWNHCVGYDEEDPDAKLIHFTQGIPCFPETEGCEHSEKWREELKIVNSTVDWEVLMGPSRHAKRVVRRA